MRDMTDRRHAGRSRMRERGAAAVEFAIILPLLVLMVGGIVDWGRFMYTQAMLTNAAREAARDKITPKGLKKGVDKVSVLGDDD